MIDLKKTGDWNIVHRLVNSFPEDISVGARRALIKTAAEAEARAVRHLRDQDLGWKPLSEEYLKSKIASGLSEKTLISSSQMMQAITSDIDTGGKKSYAGVFRKSFYKNSGVMKTPKSKNGRRKNPKRNRPSESSSKKLAISDIAKTMEYGSVKKGIPARPLWRPVYKEVREWLIKTELFSREVLDQFKRRTGGKG